MEFALLWRRITLILRHWLNMYVLIIIIIRTYGFELINLRILTKMKKHRYFSTLQNIQNLKIFEN